MTQSTQTVQEKQAMAAKAAPLSKPLAPPEEAFWVRYSPHHELPLSSVSSVAIHVLLFGLILLAVYVSYKLGLKDQDKSLPIEAVSLAGGGGGNLQGVGSEPGGKNLGDPEAVDPKPNDPQQPPPAPRPEDLNKVQPAAIKLPEYKDPDIRRLIDSANDAVVSIGQLNEDTRARLAKGLRAGQGKDGGGTSGGTGRGSGTGTGDSVGPGSGKLTQREKRVLRWVMVFNTANGEDYARQLQFMGAIVALPEPGEPNKYRVVRNLLQRPANPQPEDLSEIKRIYWVDNKPQSVDALSKALQLRQNPGHFVAFFPETLEEKLLKLELARAGSKRSEDDISETKYEIRRVGNGYEPIVVEQKYLR